MCHYGTKGCTDQSDDTHTCRVSGDGRAGATAPPESSVDALQAMLRARGVTFTDAEADVICQRVERAAFPGLLAAWIDGLTDEQLESAAWECPKLVRAALTRLGGAHE